MLGITQSLKQGSLPLRKLYSSRGRWTINPKYNIRVKSCNMSSVISRLRNSGSLGVVAVPNGLLRVSFTEKARLSKELKEVKE